MGNDWEVKISLPNGENQKVINAFLTSLKNANKSKLAVNNYRILLQCFFKERNEQFSLITMNDIQQWFSDPPKSEKNKQRYVRALGAFYNFCVAEGYIKQSPIHYKRKVSDVGVYWELKRILPNSEIQSTVNNYLLSLKNSGKKQGTIEGIRKKLQYFFLDWEKPLSSITEDDIQQWLYKHRTQWSKRTEENYVHVLRLFYSVCVEEGYIENSPFIKLKTTEIYWELQRPLPNKQNQDVINAFLLNLKNKNRSEISVKGHSIFFQFFFREQKKSFSLLTADDIQQWISEHQKNIKESTMKNYHYYLRAFYNFCLTEGYIEQSPISELDKRKAEAAGVYWYVKQYLPNVESQNMINTYLVGLKSAGNSKEEIVYKRNILGSFFQDFEKPFSSITKVDIQNWFDKYGKEWSKSTVKSYTSVLRSFYGFCKQEGYIENPPLNKKRWVKIAEKYWEIQQPLANKQNQDVINVFLLNLKNENRSKESVRKFRIYLQYFFRERKDHFSLLTADDIQQWIDEQQKDANGKRFLRHLSFVRIFYRFCIRQGYIKESPVLYHWELKGNQASGWKLKEALPNKENQRVINEFLLDIKVANMSERTMENYRLFLQRFFRDKEESFDNLEPDAILKWFVEHKNKWKKSTTSNYFAILSSFYNFCVDEGYMLKSPIKSRWFPRLPKPVPKYLEKSELVKVRLQTEKETLRNRTLVEFLLVTGCRIGEVFGLNRTDVDLEKRTATVLGKGKKIRAVHFTVKTALLLEKYLQSREDDNPALFLSTRENRLGIAAMEGVVKKIGKRVRLIGSLHPHRFRHTFATGLLAKGADISLIADQLGHKDIQTTQIYAKLPNRELISMYKKYMG